MGSEIHTVELRGYRIHVSLNEIDLQRRHRTVPGLRLCLFLLTYQFDAVHRLPPGQVLCVAKLVEFCLYFESNIESIKHQGDRDGHPATLLGFREPIGYPGEVVYNVPVTVIRLIGSEIGMFNNQLPM